MSIDFQKYALKGDEFLSILARNLGDEADKGRASRVLRSTFKVLREHITLEESVQLTAQLPMALKGLYMDGWRVNHTHPERLKSLTDFAMAVLKTEGDAGESCFLSIEDVFFCVKGVVQTMALYVSPEELDQAFGTLPKDIKELFRSWI
jgi:uncharacterized protein (DUF2267 family)